MLIANGEEELRQALSFTESVVPERISADPDIVENGLANWPPRDRPTLPGPDGQIRLQWCAGAPGPKGPAPARTAS